MEILTSLFRLLTLLVLSRLSFQQATLDKTDQCFDSQYRCASENQCAYTFVLPRPNGETCPSVRDTVRAMDRLVSENEELQQILQEIQDELTRLKSEQENGKTVLDVFTTVAPTQSTSSSCRDVEGATRCANIRGERLCFEQWSSLNQRCVDGICECNNPNYDRCTCLPKVDGCVIAIDDDDAAATYSFRGGASSGGYKVYSCRDENPSNEVHVIGNYEGNGHTGFRIHNTGTTQFNIQGRGNGNPIILVLNSYEPVNWVLNFSNDDVVISKVVLISYYLDKSNVTYQEGRVQSIERLRDAPRGYGTGSGTVELLKYVNQRFGPVTSFTGTYQADRWALSLETGVM